MDRAALAHGDLAQLRSIALEVPGFAKAWLPVVAALDDMLRHVGKIEARLARHGELSRRYRQFHRAAASGLQEIFDSLCPRVHSDPGFPVIARSIGRIGKKGTQQASRHMNVRSCLVMVFDAVRVVARRAGECARVRELMVSALTVWRRSIALAVGLCFACSKVAMRRREVLASGSTAKPFAWPARICHSPLVLMAALATGPACAGDVVFLGDFENPTSIESLRYDTTFFPGDLAELAPAIVTATTLTSGNTKLKLFLKDEGGSDQWSAIEAYGDAVGQPPDVGDCVRVKGAFVDFGGSTELSSMIWWPDSHLEDCWYFGGVVTPPMPILVSIDLIATDADPGTSGNQPGLGAESHESALVTLQNITVLATGAHTFEIYDGVNSGTYLLVDDFLYHYAATVGTHFSSITGVLNEYDGVSSTPVYQLLPRSASDIVVGP